MKIAQQTFENRNSFSLFALLFQFEFSFSFGFSFALLCFALLALRCVCVCVFALLSLLFWRLIYCWAFFLFRLPIRLFCSSLFGLRFFELRFGCCFCVALRCVGRQSACSARPANNESEPTSAKRKAVVKCDVAANKATNAAQEASKSRLIICLLTKQLLFSLLFRL